MQRIKLLSVLLPWELAVERSPAILEVAGVGAAVKLTVELWIDEGAVQILIHWVGIVAHPGAGEHLTCGAVRVEQGGGAVGVASVVVLQAQQQGGRGLLPLEEKEEADDN